MFHGSPGWLEPWFVACKIAMPDALWVLVFLLWSSGDGMWLFLTLVCLIAGHSVSEFVNLCVHECMHL